MASPLCEGAIVDAVRRGHALLRFISADDVGLTESHQWGCYLSESDDVGPILRPQKPKNGLPFDHRVRIVWQNGRVTQRIPRGRRRIAGECSSLGSARFGNPRRL